MARTDLLTRLQQLFRDFQAAELSGQSVIDIQNQRLHTTSTRREFLKAAGVTGAIVALEAPARLLAGPQPRIAIVGGGIAGLNGALTLQDAGYASTIYEASSRIGGRMHSDTTSWANGQVTEHCGELIDSTHKTILGLAKRFKIPVADLSAAEPRKSTDTDYLFGEYYPQSQRNDDFNAVYQAVKKDLIAASFPTLYNNYTSAGLGLDHLSVYDWIEARVPGGHNSPMGQLLDVAYNIELGADTPVQSALNLVYLLGFQPTPGNFRIFGRSDERYHLVGGNEGLPRAIAETLPGSSIQIGTELSGIAKNADGSYALSFSRGHSKFTVTADRVILALPFSILRNLDYSAAGFNAVKTTAIQQLGYGTNAKLHLQFTNRIWNQVGPWGISNGSSLSDTGYQNTWEVSRAQPGQTGILSDYTGGPIVACLTGDRTEQSVVQSYALQCLSQLRPVFPEIPQYWNGRATLDTPARNPYSLGSYSYWRTGQYTSIAG